MGQIDLNKYADVQYFQYPARSVSLAGNATDLAQQIKISEDADFLIQKIVGSQTGNYNLQMLDKGSGRNLLSAVTQQTCIVGTAQKPNVLLIPHLLYANSSVGFTLTDTSGSTNTIETVLEGLKCYRALPSDVSPRGRVDLSQYVEQVYYGYEALATSLAGNASTVLTVPILADSDFLITHFIARRTGTFRCKITDTSLGRQWQDALVDDVNVFGTAQNPAVLLRPQLVLANSTLVIEITETSGSTNTIELLFQGTKLFRTR